MPSKKIKVLMFSDIFGGKNTFIHNELINLKDQCNFLYLALAEIPNTHLKKHFSNFKILNLKDNIFSRKFKWWLWKSDIYLSFKNKTFSKQLHEEVKAFSPDIIHLQFGYEALKFLENGYDNTHTYIIHFHGYGASSLFRKKSYVKKLKYYLNKSNIHQIHVSRFITKRFESFNLNTSRVHHINCGVELEKFPQHTFKTQFDTSKTIHLTQVSSQVEKKGIPYTIQGFALFLEEFPTYKAKLFITGEATLKNKQLIHKLNIEEHVCFTGLLDHKQVEELLKKTDVFLHPSITSASGDEEGIPTAIMEAIACGIPLITTKHAGIPELIDHDINAILVEEKQADQIKSALYSIINTPKKDIDTHQYLKEKKFDLTSHLNQITELYQALSNNKM